MIFNKSPLREIIIQGVYNQIYILNTFGNLYGSPLDLTPEEEKELYYLQGTIHELNGALNKSICKCPLCTQTDKDMVYIDLYEEWYCVECYENDLIWYHPLGSEEDRRQHDYINYYYEQKEKFTKRFLNKDKLILNKIICQISKLDILIYSNIK